MRLLYTCFVYLYSAVIHIAALKNKKARLWVEGRKLVGKQLAELPHKGYYWFHAASLGEFEQGRPLMEKLKRENAEAKILLTFFSPSGYEVRKKYAFADVVLYLPADTPANVKRFMESVQPAAAFFIKYEFWFNYLYALKQQQVPCYLVSGVFRANQHFFAAYGTWFRKQLHSFTHFFLQDETSYRLLQKLGFTNCTISGDTRYDRCLENAAQKKDIPEVRLFAGNHVVLVAGSTWPAEERILAESFPKWPENTRLIIAPHEIHLEHLQAIEDMFPCPVLRFSHANEESLLKHRVLLIDNIGMLSSLYAYAQIAFIGGGFHNRLHNVLEAAVYGMPVLFGNHHEKNQEAQELIQAGAALSVNSADSLQNILQELIHNKQKTARMKAASAQFVAQRAGATERIYRACF